MSCVSGGHAASSDHNPLIPILNSHHLDEIENPRSQCLRTQLMEYNFMAIWCKGSTHMAPDALSRHPVKELIPEDSLAEFGEDHISAPSIAEIRMQQTTVADNLCLTELRRQASQDEEYTLLKATILDGFPAHRGELPEACKRYWQVRHNLTVEEDLIVYGCRLLMPSRMRKDTLQQLHESHQGPSRGYASQCTGQE